MDSFDASYLWASLLWGSIGSGFLLYGWRQKSSVPLVGGILLTVVSIFVGSALLMSLLCVLILGLIWWANRYLG